MTFLTSDQADDFFRSLFSKGPDQVIAALSYVEQNLLREDPDTLFEYDSDHNHAWYLLGLAYEKIGNTKRAAECFLVAAKICPDDGDAFVAFSNTEVDLETQIPILESALKRLNDPRIRFNLANAYLDLGEPDKALRHLALVSETWPIDVDVSTSLRRAQDALARKSNLPK